MSIFCIFSCEAVKLSSTVLYPWSVFFSFLCVAVLQPATLVDPAEGCGSREAVDCRRLNRVAGAGRFGSTVRRNAGSVGSAARWFVGMVGSVDLAACERNGKANGMEGKGHNETAIRFQIEHRATARENVLSYKP